MEAQPILLVKAVSVRKQESAASGMSDVFQAILREREIREFTARDETAPTAISRQEVERDPGRPAMARRRSDAAQETRNDDRYPNPRDERSEAHDIQAADQHTWHGHPDESQPRTDRPDRGAESAEVGAQEHDEAPQTSETPVETGPAADGAPQPASPVIAANSAVAGNPANAVTAQGQDVAVAPEPASPKDAASNPRRPAVNSPAAVADPMAALGEVAATPAQTESETAPAPAMAAVKATQSPLPAAPAEAGVPLDAVHVKRPRAPGHQAGTATALTEAVEDMGTPDKENQASTAAKVQPVRAEQPRANPAMSDRADHAGHKTGATPLVRDPAAPGGHAAANQAPTAPSSEAPGQRTQAASDPATQGLKSAASTGFTGQATAGLTAIDPMQGAARAADARPASTPVANRPVTPGEVVVNIQRAAARGDDRIRIRLHPAELGQVDVRLKVGADGIVRAMVQVDRPETLEFMQRDARGLERALQDAGLKTDSGSLSFNLRDNGQGGLRDRDGEAPVAEHEQANVNPPPAVEEAEIQIHAGWSSRALDIRV